LRDPATATAPNWNQLDELFTECDDEIFALAIKWMDEHCCDLHDRLHGEEQRHDTEEERQAMAWATSNRKLNRQAAWRHIEENLGQYVDTIVEIESKRNKSHDGLVDELMWQMQHCEDLILELRRKSDQGEGAQSQSLSQVMRRRSLHSGVDRLIHEVR